MLAPGGQDFRHDRFSYPGDESDVSINMLFSPGETLLRQHVGFHVYGPRPDRAPLPAGIRQGLNPNLSVDAINREAGTDVVQVHNDDPVSSVPFTIWASR